MASMLSIRRTLSRVSEQLSEDEVSSLRFLCRDELTSWASLAPVDLLTALFTKGGNAQLIAKLTALHRQDILRRMGLHNATLERGAYGKDELVGRRSSGSPTYREFLVELNERISSEELTTMKYCLQDHFPPKKLKNVNSLLELCQLLEQEGQLSADNLSMLKECLDFAGRNDLIKKVNQFKLTSPEGAALGRERFVRMPDRVYVNAHPAPLSGAMHMGVHNTQTHGGGRGRLVGNSYDSGSPSASGIASPLMSRYPDARSHNPMCQQIPVRSSAVQAARVGSKATSSSTPETDGYAMIAPLGLCLLVLNVEGLKTARALIKDAEKIRKTFCHLGFKVNVLKNLSSKQLRQLYRYCEVNKMHSCFVCVVLGKGTDSEVIGTDGIPVSIEMLSMGFKGQHCPALMGKPKLFFILTVMVANEFDHQSLQVDSSWPIDDDYLETDAPGIPSDADVLECKHLVEEGAIYPYEANNIGTPFIQHLTDCLTELWPMGHDVLAVLTEVNRRVASVSHGLQQRPPKLSNTLRKRLILPQTQGSVKHIA